MPRQARLDIPGLLQHVIVRGIDRTDIFADDHDRRDFLARLGRLLVETETDCFAWALIPNHVHLLLRSNRTGLSCLMRRLLTGYAVTFNRRHGRAGHLFQNRYRSIVCEEDPYLLELIRYIHLNPVRAALVENLEELERYPWSGHTVLLGRGSLAGQKVNEVLALFATEAEVASLRYQQFLIDGLPQGKRPELTGGGLRRNQALGDDSSRISDFDGRVLGGSCFVASLREKAHINETMPRTIDLDDLSARIAALLNLAPEEMKRRGRRNSYSEARELFCYLAVQVLRHSGAKVGAQLNMGVPSVSRAARRGEALVAARPEISSWWEIQLKQ